MLLFATVETVGFLPFFLVLSSSFPFLPSFFLSFFLFFFFIFSFFLSFFLPSTSLEINSLNSPLALCESLHLQTGRQLPRIQNSRLALFCILCTHFRYVVFNCFALYRLGWGFGCLDTTIYDDIISSGRSKTSVICPNLTFVEINNY